VRVCIYARSLHGALPIFPALLAALALLVVAPWGSAPTDDPRGDNPTIRIKGDASLRLYTLQQGVLTPWGGEALGADDVVGFRVRDRKSTRLNSSHVKISY